jgi:hypothetical protein
MKKRLVEIRSKDWIHLSKYGVQWRYFIRHCDVVPKNMEILNQLCNYCVL